MTDPFDYSGLASHVRAITLPHHASDVLRTRIEAAFVPVERYNERTETFRLQLKIAVEATARAEAAEAIADDVHKALWAAEARVKVLEETLRRYANVYGVLTDSDREYIAQALGAEHEQ